MTTRARAIHLKHQKQHLLCKADKAPCAAAFEIDFQKSDFPALMQTQFSSQLRIKHAINAEKPCLPCHSRLFLFLLDPRVGNPHHLCRNKNWQKLINRRYFRQRQFGTALYRPSSIIPPVTSLVVESSWILIISTPEIQDLLLQRS